MNKGGGSRGPSSTLNPGVDVLMSQELGASTEGIRQYKVQYLFQMTQIKALFSAYFLPHDISVPNKYFIIIAKDQMGREIQIQYESASSDLFCSLVYLYKSTYTDA